MICTHAHKDHINAIPYLKEIVGVINNKRAGSKEPLKFNDYTECCIQPWMLKKENFDVNTISEVLTTFYKKLSEVKFFKLSNVQTTIWMPNYDEDELPLFDDVHDYNLIVKITYAGRDLLFTGDASGRLLTRLEEDENAHYAILNNIDVFLFPHHGSNRSSEYSWFWAAVGNRNTFRYDGKIISIISSDPQYDNNLPWVSIKRLFRSTRTRHLKAVNSHNMITACKQQKYSELTDALIFLTCCAGGWYKISVQPTGTLALCGNNNVDLLSEIDDRSMEE